MSDDHSVSAYAGPPPPGPNDWAPATDRLIVPLDVPPEIPSDMARWFVVERPDPAEEFRDAVRKIAKAAVAEALRDPAMIAAALMKLPAALRDHVRVLLDALESGGYDGPETP